MEKSIRISIITILVLVLAACINNSTNNSIVFKGDYSGAAFTSGSYSDGGATLVIDAVTDGTAKFTCPNKYVFLPFLSAPADQSPGRSVTCNRQDGCDTYSLGWSSSAFTASNFNTPQGTSFDLFNNNDGNTGELLATCVNQDQISDWSA